MTEPLCIYIEREGVYITYGGVADGHRHYCRKGSYFCVPEGTVYIEAITDYEGQGEVPIIIGSSEE